MIYDMHCHLDFAEDAAAAAREAAVLGIGALSATVTPSSYAALRDKLEAAGNVRTGLGLHPWWLADGRCGEEDAALFEQLAPGARFIGEIGLDFAGARGEEACRTLQLATFERILRACAGAGANTAAGSDTSASAHKILSLHAVRAASDVLDLLERSGALAQHSCIFHWISGTSDELQRAIAAGCYFSVGPRMLTTKRGRAYAQAIPANRLLLETDLPAKPGAPFSIQEWKAQLEGTIAELASIKKAKPSAFTSQIAQTSAELLLFDLQTARFNA